MLYYSGVCILLLRGYIFLLQTGNHIPSELVVSIHLPRLSSAAPCNLDVTEYNLTLETTQPVVYRLSIKLPHPVDDENGSAKFDKAKKMLVSEFVEVLDSDLGSDIC